MLCSMFIFRMYLFTQFNYVTAENSFTNDHDCLEFFSPPQHNLFFVINAWYSVKFILISFKNKQTLNICLTLDDDFQIIEKIL